MLALSLGEHHSYSVQESQGRVQGGVCQWSPSPWISRTMLHQENKRRGMMGKKREKLIKFELFSKFWIFFYPGITGGGEFPSDRFRPPPPSSWVQLLLMQEVLLVDLLLP